MALTSPGVEVKVIDESFYTPAEPGTVPLIIVASAQDKQNGAGDGTAPGTTKANAGQVYLITSQKDLVDTFGDPSFKTDANNNPIHAGEQNEYGLQAAYSLLGVSNRAYVVRADVDLDQLSPSATAPDANPESGTHWLDTQTTAFGIFQWNGAPATTTGGQTFTNKVPMVITDPTKIDPGTGGPNARAGGEIGDYAIIAVDDTTATPALTTSHPLSLWVKTRAGTWKQVGSQDWAAAVPTVAGSKAVTGAITNTWDFGVNGETITGNTSLAAIASDINANATLGTYGITAAVVSNKLEIYSSIGNAVVITAGSTGTLIGSTGTLGILAGTYNAPSVQISKHTTPPLWKGAQNGSSTPSGNTPRPTGSVWIKTTENNLGARWRFKRWNSETLSWVAVEAPIYDSNVSALYGLSKTAGGFTLPVGQLYIQAVDANVQGAPVQFKVWRRGATTQTVVRTAKITDTTFTAGSYTLEIAETLVNDPALSADVTVSFSATGNADDDALALAAVFNEAGLTNVVAEVDSQNRVLIKHLKGGDIHVTDVDGALADAGIQAYDYEPSSGSFGTGTKFVTDDQDGQHDFIFSNWEPLVYVAADDAPGSLTADGTLWYNSVVDEVDLMIHNGDRWVGYLDPTSPYYDADPANQTDPLGPIVSATVPEKQSDGTDLVTGDIWIDTSDIENYPVIYKFNKDLANKPIKDRWILVDKTDQSSEDGVLFADARYNTSGVNSDVAGTIEDLLTSNFVDTDAPDPALYPRGMILWNLRRSGFNVKRFVQNYIDTAEDNIRFGSAPTFTGEAMADYYPHRWVTESGNQDDGSGSFGRKAQRKVVVQKLQALVNSNQQIRDEDARVFNLIACPGYPELIGEMITLNYDRGLTAFVVGDTPARLTADATSLNRWGMNLRLALEDNDLGAASYDEYMAMFYPWGFTSDNFGNNVVVPPSHMMLRTIALSDQVSYPWFAPAGLRRGGITNATAVGYVNSEGEFTSVALNNGQRDTLYEAKINPITFFTGSGLVNYGQKTRAKTASALDRINVARLICYLRRQLNALAKPYIFEPNDKITREEIKGAVESLMLELVGQRALYDYLVVCDESNNTPSRIDRNELWVDVAIEPVKAVEFIYIPLRIKNTGEIKGL